MICDFNDTAHSTRDISVQYEGCLGGGGKEGGGGGGGVEGGALLVLLTQKYELLLGWLSLISLLFNTICFTCSRNKNGVCGLYLFSMLFVFDVITATKPHHDVVRGFVTSFFSFLPLHHLPGQ